MLPVSHNVDSFGYRMDMLPKGLDINQESWSWLLDKRWKGTLDAAYNYLNWWISGWPSSVMTRQGYYISTPELTRPHLSAAERDFWYGGKPAAKSLQGPDDTSDLFH
ncbi:hypothetical protein [Halomonas sp. SpR8]|uniref:hypothetical protein n=1 Tax=Halomonas sp. SpR8 TaxID=3050463 RepID=UPI0027E5469C|nr:hypothetical protein [Halomonas sp. SpR8]MDQ7729555.1 hypothetical protein [Halomonas sp. SpR8]